MGQHNNNSVQVLNPLTPAVATWALNASFATPWVRCIEFDRLSYTFATSAAGTVGGTLALRVSDFGFSSASSTYQTAIGRPTDLPTVANSSLLVATGTTATSAVNSTGYRVFDNQVCYSWIRLEFTDTSGGTNTGSATIALTQKSLSRA